MKTESSLGTRSPVSSGKSVLEQLSAPKSPARAGRDAISSLSFRTLMADIRPGGFEDMTKRMTERRAEQQRLEKERQRERPRAEDLHGNAQVMQRPAEPQRSRQADEVRQADRVSKAARQPERTTTARNRDADTPQARGTSTPASDARPAASRADDARTAGASSARAPAHPEAAQTTTTPVDGKHAADADGNVSAAGQKPDASASAAGGAAAGQATAADGTQAAAGAGKHAGTTTADAAATRSTTSAGTDSLADQVRQAAQVQQEAAPVSETELQQLARQMGLGDPSAAADEARVAGGADTPTEAAAPTQDVASADANDLSADARSTDAEGPVVAGAPVAAGSTRRASAASGNATQAAHDGRIPANATARATSTALPQTGTATEVSASSRPVTAEAGPAALPAATVTAGRAEGGTFSLGMALPTPAAHSPVRTDGSPLLSSRIDSPISSAEFKEQFARQVAGVVVQGQDRAEIRLTPAELGPIRIRVSLNADDAALDISAAHAATRAAIESSMSTLKQMLADHGLRLADYRMDQGNNAAFLSQQRQPGQENGAGMQQSGTAFGQNGGQSGSQQAEAGSDTGRTGRATGSRPAAVSGSTGGGAGVGNTPSNGRLDLFA